MSRSEARNQILVESTALVSLYTKDTGHIAEDMKRENKSERQETKDRGAPIIDRAIGDNADCVLRSSETGNRQVKGEKGGMGDEKNVGEKCSAHRKIS
jgi:alpha-D-ribose 1-methylphosphonate 5-triphosphate synthase subunit PhnG